MAFPKRPQRYEFIDLPDYGEKATVYAASPLAVSAVSIHWRAVPDVCGLVVVGISS